MHTHIHTHTHTHTKTHTHAQTHTTHTAQKHTYTYTHAHTQTHTTHNHTHHTHTPHTRTHNQTNTQTAPTHARHTPHSHTPHTRTPQTHYIPHTPTHTHTYAHTHTHAHTQHTQHTQTHTCVILCVFVCVSLFFMCSHASSHCLRLVSLCVCVSKTYFNGVCINNVLYVHIGHWTVQYVCVFVSVSLFWCVHTRRCTVCAFNAVCINILYVHIGHSTVRFVMSCDVMCACVCSKTFFNCVALIMFYVFTSGIRPRDVWCVILRVFIYVSLFLTLFISSLSVCVCSKNSAMVFALIMFYMFTSGIRRCHVWYDVSVCVCVCFSLSDMFTRVVTVFVSRLSLCMCVFQDSLHCCLH